MRIGGLARRAQVTVKAVRCGERIGLLVPARTGNGYRSFDEADVRAVTEIRELGLIGIPPRRDVLRRRPDSSAARTSRRRLP